jgi:uncharacterized membrane protein YjjP (DUF1212 family)/uncharacterized membrane protein YjjB (DUF3815 family)
VHATRGCDTIELVPSDSDRLHAVFDLAMRIGVGLLTNGSAASEVTATVLQVLGSSGIRDVVVQVTFDEVALSYLPADPSKALTQVRTAGVRGQDFARLAEYEAVTDHYIAGDLGLDDALARVAAISRRRPYYPHLLVIMGFALMGGAAALSFGGSFPVVLAAALASGLLIWAIDSLAKAHVPMFFAQALAGLIGVVVASLVSFVDPTQSASIVVVACIVVALAGLASIGAMQDAITGWYVTASARILETLMLTVGLVVGVRAGLMLADVAGRQMVISDPLPLTLGNVLVLVVAGVFMGLGYGVGTQTPTRLLVWCAAVAAMSAGAAYALGGLVQRPWAVAVAAALVGVVAVVLARWQRAPALLFVMAGIIPLVPGSRIFRGLLAMGTDMPAGAGELFGAAEIAVGIAAGATIGQMVAARVLLVRGRVGWAYTPVIAPKFATMRRRRITLPLRHRRRHDPEVTEPSTMTGVMTALPESLRAELVQELGSDPTGDATTASPERAAGHPEGDTDQQDQQDHRDDQPRSRTPPQES